MAFLSIYDSTGELECVIFPKLYNDENINLTIGMVYIGEVKIEKRNDNLQGIINKIKQI